MESLRNLDRKIILKMRKLMSMKMSTVMKRDKQDEGGRKKDQRKPFLT